MSINSSVKEHIYEHFSNSPISRHWNHHFHNSNGFNRIKSENEDQKLEIRKFSFEDMDNCAKLFKNVFSAYPWYDNWVSDDQARKYLIELIENPVFEGFVVYEGSNIVAVCFGHKRSWWIGKEFFIDEFYVSNLKQGNGLGTQLLDYVKKTLIQEDYSRLVLLTNKEIPAEDFYIKNGFHTNQSRISMISEL
jgi:GNAT superfamily N-acetyltransferase